MHRGRLAILEIHFDETDAFTKAWRGTYWQFGAGLHAYTDSNSLTPTDSEPYNGLHAAIDMLLDDLGSPERVALQRTSTVTRIER